MKVEHIDGDILPINMPQKIPWDKMKCCMVSYIDQKGTVRITSSTMDWADRAWIMFVMDKMMGGQYKDLMDQHDTAK